MCIKVGNKLNIYLIRTVEVVKVLVRQDIFFRDDRTKISSKLNKPVQCSSWEHSHKYSHWVYVLGGPNWQQNTIIRSSKKKKTTHIHTDTGSLVADDICIPGTKHFGNLWRLTNCFAENRGRKRIIKLTSVHCFVENEAERANRFAEKWELLFFKKPW